MSHFDPTDIINKIDEYSEMTKEQLMFLRGLIEKEEPSKILEVGVASGGTTAVILKVVSDLNLKTEVVSVDKSEVFYRDKTKKTGFIAMEYIKMLQAKPKWTYRAGNYLAEIIKEIGNGIDLVILDTMHVLPGEILDFLVVLPYLSKKAVVVLHDVAYHHIGENKDAFATQVLLNCVCADEIYPKSCEEICGYPNIAAFRINQDTQKYISNVFGTLRLTWKYLITDYEKDIYYNFYLEQYGKKYADILEIGYNLNRLTLKRYNLRKNTQQIEVIRFFLTLNNKKISIYGYGNYGKKLRSILEQSGIKVDKIFVSDNIKIDQKDGLYHLSEIKCSEKDEVIIIAAGKELQQTLVENMKQAMLSNYLCLDDEIRSFLDEWKDSI